MTENADITRIATDLRAAFSLLKRRLREEGAVGDFSPSQKDVLRQLEQHGPATVSGLARACGMRPQSMGTIVATLQSAGCVTGTPDPADGRQTLVSLTPRFRKKLVQGSAALDDWLTGRIAQLSAAEQTHLLASIEILRRMAGH